jgi:20S proteasome alpha/beta subunit
VVGLVEILRPAILQYKWSNKEDLSCKGFAYFLSSMLFQRRGFPYFAFCTVGGIDSNGKLIMYFSSSCEGVILFLFQVVVYCIVSMPSVLLNKWLPLAPAKERK